MNILDLIARPETLLMAVYENFVSDKIREYLKKLEFAKDDAAVNLKAKIKAWHKNFIKVEAFLISAMPIAFAIILSATTLALFNADGEWASLQRFGVVWILVSIYFFVLQYRTDYLKSVTGPVHKIFERLPQECRWEDADSEYKKRAQTFLHTRTIVEILMLTVGTFLTGYGDLLENWLHSFGI